MARAKKEKEIPEIVEYEKVCEEICVVKNEDRQYANIIYKYVNKYVDKVVFEDGRRL